MRRTSALILPPAPGSPKRDEDTTSPKRYKGEDGSAVDARKMDTPPDTPEASPLPRPKAKLTSQPTVTFSLNDPVPSPSTNRLRSVPTLKYSTTTVLRRIDADGNPLDNVPLSYALKNTASFATRRELLEQEKRKPPTPGEIVSKKVLRILTQNFIAKQSYDYDQKEASHDWKSKEAIQELLSCVDELCKETTNVLKKDPMLVRLRAPVYILGDLHGNYKDLQLFAKNFWNMGVNMCAGKLLFLGDYVDRGPHSAELVCYLFALKVLHPNRVFLLRGNHEFPDQNGDAHYNPCFRTSCIKLFGSKGSAGRKAWEAFNSAFDYLPIAATIDNKIFCCHGGIPRAMVPGFGETPKKKPKKKKATKKKAKAGQNKRKKPGADGSVESLERVDESDESEEEEEDEETEESKDKDLPLLDRIAAIPRPLKDDYVNDEDPTFLALDLLWSDPATNEEEKEKLGGGDEEDTDEETNGKAKGKAKAKKAKAKKDELTFDSLFAENDRGGNAVVFGTKAMDEFVRQTGCQHLIRAHQPPSHGFEYAKRARIITVFSSSHYCGGFNSAAIVLASDDGKLRVATTVTAKPKEAESDEESMSDEDESVEEYDTD